MKSRTDLLEISPLFAQPKVHTHLTSVSEAKAHAEALLQKATGNAHAKLHWTEKGRNFTSQMVDGRQFVINHLHDENH